MTISAMNSTGSQAIDDLAAIRKAAAAAAAAATSTNATQSTMSIAAPDTTSVSGPGALLSKLKGLEASDPAKFKEVMSKISDKLKADASSATDPKEQKALTDLSTKFAAAGQSGDLSQLAPPNGGGGAGGGHGKHHHGGGGGGGGSGASGAGAVSAATDPADANKDGTVTDAERAAYAAVAATQSSSTNGAQAYAKANDGGPQAMSKMAGVMSSITSIVDAAM
jgi:hypothetical protein